MPNPSHSSVNDCLSIGSTGRLAGRMIEVCAVALFLIGTAAAYEPATQTGSSVQRSNPFVDSLRKGDRNGTASSSLSPVARVRLQVPQVKTVSTPAASVFVGPSWDTQQFDTRESQTELVANSRVSPITPLKRNAIANAGGTSRPKRLPAALPNPQDAFTNNHSSHSKLVSAAKKRTEFLSNQRQTTSPSSSVYLATRTAQSQFEIAAELLQQAQLEYDCSAFASAETSVWQSLGRSAQAIDLAIPSGTRSNEEISALKRLHHGRRALIEACDFVGPFAQQDPLAIARLARAHETPVLRETLPPMRTTFSQFATSTAELPTASEAIDRYLDHARMQFSVLSSKSLLAAQTLDMLAAIRLGRNELAQLPGPTAICLRRAAVQGQSSNADLVAKLGHHLADVGLIDEARWALRHSVTLQANRINSARLAALDAAAMHTSRSTPATTNLGSSVLAATRSRTRTPDVITMSPEQFASISHSVMPGRSADPPSTDSSTKTDTSSRPAQMVSSQASSVPSANEKQSFLRAFTASFRTDPGGAIIVPPQQNQPQPARRMSSRSLPVVKKWW